ncbi:hypothetical protein GQ55_6G048400 [Panicum hallii var. hallii]|uniref:Uncharacterized protein n=1 Tax=Panicum hallii var. hallii TaxID=1504633 RepID=A0A2T7D3Z0_9POAL|nr:hypothetical protein GQ55_6G048400 [Panicum hallii var. hallii]
MASSLPSPSLPRKLLRYMSSRLGALHRSPLRVQPKLVAVSATIATAAAATAAYYPEPAGGRHGDGISADGDAAARVPTSGVNVAATSRQLLVVAERNARGRSAEPALESMAKRTPKEGKGGGGGDIHVVSSLAAAGAVVLLHARRWLAK